MSNPNNWPFPETPGVPLHPERNGVHVIRLHENGKLIALRWRADQGGMWAEPGWEIPGLFGEDEYLGEVSLGVPETRNACARPSIPNGFYRHYKGGVYEVYGLSQTEKTGEWDVLYRNAHSLEPFHRPAKEWDNPIPALNCNRFTYIGTETP